MIKQENLDFFLVQVFGQPPLEPEESKSFLGVLAGKTDRLFVSSPAAAVKPYLIGACLPGAMLSIYENESVARQAVDCLTAMGIAVRFIPKELSQSDFDNALASIADGSAKILIAPPFPLADPTQGPQVAAATANVGLNFVVVHDLLVAGATRPPDELSFILKQMYPRALGAMIAKVVTAPGSGTPFPLPEKIGAPAVGLTDEERDELLKPLPRAPAPPMPAAAFEPESDEEAGNPTLMRNVSPEQRAALLAAGGPKKPSKPVVMPPTPPPMPEPDEGALLSTLEGALAPQDDLPDSSPDDLGVDLGLLLGEPEAKDETPELFVPRRSATPPPPAPPPPPKPVRSAPEVDALDMFLKQKTAEKESDAELDDLLGIGRGPSDVPDTDEGTLANLQALLAGEVQEDPLADVIEAVLKAVADCIAEPELEAKTSKKSAPPKPEPVLDPSFEDALSAAIEPIVDDDGLAAAAASALEGDAGVDLAAMLDDSPLLPGMDLAADAISMLESEPVRPVAADVSVDDLAVFDAAAALGGELDFAELLPSEDPNDPVVAAPAPVAISEDELTAFDAAAAATAELAAFDEAAAAAASFGFDDPVVEQPPIEPFVDQYVEPYPEVEKTVVMKPRAPQPSAENTLVGDPADFDPLAGAALEALGAFDEPVADPLAGASLEELAAFDAAAAAATELDGFDIPAAPVDEGTAAYDAASALVDDSTAYEMLPPEVTAPAVPADGEAWDLSAFDEPAAPAAADDLLMPILEPGGDDEAPLVHAEPVKRARDADEDFDAEMFNALKLADDVETPAVDAAPVASQPDASGLDAADEDLARSLMSEIDEMTRPDAPAHKPTATMAIAIEDDDPVGLSLDLVDGAGLDAPSEVFEPGVPAGEGALDGFGDPLAGFGEAPVEGFADYAPAGDQLTAEEMFSPGEIPTEELSPAAELLPTDGFGTIEGFEEPAIAAPVEELTLDELAAVDEVMAANANSAASQDSLELSGEMLDALGEATLPLDESGGFAEIPSDGTELSGGLAAAPDGLELPLDAGWDQALEMAQDGLDAGLPAEVQPEALGLGDELLLPADPLDGFGQPVEDQLLPADDLASALDGFGQPAELGGEDLMLPADDLAGALDELSGQFGQAEVASGDEMLLPADELLPDELGLGEAMLPAAPVDEFALPADELLTPADELLPDELGLGEAMLPAAPVDEFALPADELLTPADQLLSPDELVPATDELLPPTDELLPPADELLLGTDELLPATDELPPATDELLPATDELLPATDELLPATDELLAATDELLPATDELLAATDELLPATDELLPAPDELLPPTDELASPLDELQLPADDLALDDELPLTAADFALPEEIVEPAAPVAVAAPVDEHQALAEALRGADEADASSFDEVLPTDVDLDTITALDGLVGEASEAVGSFADGLDEIAETPHAPELSDEDVALELADLENLDQLEAPVEPRTPPPLERARYQVRPPPPPAAAVSGPPLVLELPRGNAHAEARERLEVAEREERRVLAERVNARAADAAATLDLFAAAAAAAAASAVALPSVRAPEARERAPRTFQNRSGGGSSKVLEISYWQQEAADILSGLSALSGSVPATPAPVAPVTPVPPVKPVEPVEPLDSAPDVSVVVPEPVALADTIEVDLDAIADAPLEIAPHVDPDPSMELELALEDVVADLDIEIKPETGVIDEAASAELEAALDALPSAPVVVESGEDVLDSLADLLQDAPVEVMPAGVPAETGDALDALDGLGAAEPASLDALLDLAEAAKPDAPAPAELDLSFLDDGGAAPVAVEVPDMLADVPDVAPAAVPVDDLGLDLGDLSGGGGMDLEAGLDLPEPAQASRNVEVPPAAEIDLGFLDDEPTGAAPVVLDEPEPASVPAVSEVPSFLADLPGVGTPEPPTVPAAPVDWLADDSDEPEKPAQSDAAVEAAAADLFRDLNDDQGDFLADLDLGDARPEKPALDDDPLGSLDAMLEDATKAGGPGAEPAVEIDLDAAMDADLADLSKSFGTQEHAPEVGGLGGTPLAGSLEAALEALEDRVAPAPVEPAPAPAADPLDLDLSSFAAMEKPSKDDDPLADLSASLVSSLDQLEPDRTDPLSDLSDLLDANPISPATPSPAAGEEPAMDFDLPSFLDDAPSDKDKKKDGAPAAPLPEVSEQAMAASRGVLESEPPVEAPKPRKTGKMLNATMLGLFADATDAPAGAESELPELPATPPPPKKEAAHGGHGGHGHEKKHEPPPPRAPSGPPPVMAAPGFLDAIPDNAGAPAAPVAAPVVPPTPVVAAKPPPAPPAMDMDLGLPELSDVLGESTPGLDAAPSDDAMGGLDDLGLELEGELEKMAAEMDRKAVKPVPAETSADTSLDTLFLQDEKAPASASLDDLFGNDAPVAAAPMPVVEPEPELELPAEPPAIELPSFEEPRAERDPEDLPPAVVLPDVGPEIGDQVSSVLKDILSEYPDDVMLKPASDAPPRPQVVIEPPPAPPVVEPVVAPVAVMAPVTESNAWLMPEPLAERGPSEPFRERPREVVITPEVQTQWTPPPRAERAPPPPADDWDEAPPPPRAARTPPPPPPRRGEDIRQEFDLPREGHLYFYELEGGYDKRLDFLNRIWDDPDSDVDALVKLLPGIEKAFPEDARVPFAAGVLNMLAEKRVASLTGFNRALDLLDAHGEFDGARVILKLLHGAFPDDVGVTERLVDVLDRLDAKGEAASILEELSQAAAARDHVKRALAYLERAAQLDGTNLRVALAQVKIYRASGDESRVLEAANRALTARPDDGLLLFYKAQALARLGRTRAAETCMDKALGRAAGDLPLLKKLREELRVGTDERDKRRVADMIAALEPQDEAPAPREEASRDLDSLFAEPDEDVDLPPRRAPVPPQVIAPPVRQVIPPLPPLPPPPAPVAAVESTWAPPPPPPPPRAQRDPDSLDAGDLVGRLKGRFPRLAPDLGQLGELESDLNNARGREMVQDKQVVDLLKKIQGIGDKIRVSAPDDAAQMYQKGLGYLTWFKDPFMAVAWRDELEKKIRAGAGRKA